MARTQLRTREWLTLEAIDTMTCSFFNDDFVVYLYRNDAGKLLFDMDALRPGGKRRRHAVTGGPKAGDRIYVSYLLQSRKDEWSTLEKRTPFWKRGKGKATPVYRIVSMWRLRPPSKQMLKLEAEDKERGSFKKPEEELK